MAKSKQYWTLGHYSRGSGQFTLEGRFETAHDACASVGMKAWMYDPKTDTYIPFKDDGKNVRAECGVSNTNLINTYQVAFRVVIPEIVLSTKTKLPKPSETRKVIGVGEEITVFSNTPVSWEISSDLVRIVNQSRQSVTFVALDKAGSVSVTAKNEEYQKTVSIRIVQPTSIKYIQAYRGSQPRIHHPKNGYQLGVGLWAVVQPETANFHNIVLREIDSAATNTGIFNDGQTHCHIAGKQEPNTPCKGVSQILRISDGKEILNACIPADFDIAGGGENDANKIKQLPARSTATFIIPLQWKLASDSTAQWHDFPKPVKQTLVLLKNGNITVTKGNFSKTMTLADDFNDETVLNKEP